MILWRHYFLVFLLYNFLFILLLLLSLLSVSCCFAALRQLRQIRRYVPTSTFQKLVVSPGVFPARLDYGNGVLVGIPAHLMRRLQSVLNATARLIFNLKRSNHITDALVSLHWLRVPERMQYKIAVYKVLHDTAPRYLGPLTRVADIPGRRALRSGSTLFLTFHHRRPNFSGWIWNSLPDTVVSASTLRSFQHQLKTFFYFNDPLFIMDARSA